MLKRGMLLAALVLAALFGPSRMEGLVASGAGAYATARGDRVRSNEGSGAPTEDIGDAAGALGRTGDKLAEVGDAIGEIVDPSKISANGRARLHRWRRSYDSLRLVWLLALASAPAVWILVGFGAAYGDLAFVARRLGESGQWLAESWLALLAVAAPIATLLTGELVWLFVPAELVVVPVTWLLGCAGMLQVIDANAPVWNQTVRALGLFTLGLLASGVARAITPAGASVLR
jgi:hypothetical protein